MRVSLEQAACDALAAWLQGQLDADLHEDVVVEPRWFEVDRQLPARAISIIAAGPRKLEFDDPVALVTAPGSTSAKTLISWSLGWVEQAVQLDAWATRDAELDSLVARLDAPLNAGQRPLGLRNPDPISTGLVLQLAGEWEECTASIAFGETSRTQTPGSAVEGEWRATVRGTAHLRLAVKAESAKIARIRIQNLLDGNVETTTIT